ncbi:MAG: hypothetical protein ACKPBT_11540, partial [Microcystis aeruginosa]
LTLATIFGFYKRSIVEGEKGEGRKADGIFWAAMVKRFNPVLNISPVFSKLNSIDWNNSMYANLWMAA